MYTIEKLDNTGEPINVMVSGVDELNINVQGRFFTYQIEPYLKALSDVIECGVSEVHTIKVDLASPGVVRFTGGGRHVCYNLDELKKALVELRETHETFVIESSRMYEAKVEAWRNSRLEF